MRCAQDIFDRISEEKSMTKKWLYSAALGALLMTGEALGVTVHEVLDSHFWYNYGRDNFSVLSKAYQGFYKGKYKNEVREPQPDGSVKTSYLYKANCSKLPGVALSWNYKKWYTETTSDNERVTDTKAQLNTRRDNKYKEKTVTETQEYRQLMNGGATNLVDNTRETFTVKALKMKVRPMCPYVVDDWFPDYLKGGCATEAEFYGTEQTAVTNIISDNEAYITRTIQQTGQMKNYDGYTVDEPASLLRVYNTHITTDEDHIYVDQSISELAENAHTYDFQNDYRTQYTATLKKGRWKGATETITITQNAQASDWYLNYLKSKSSQNTR